MTMLRSAESTDREVAFARLLAKQAVLLTSRPSDIMTSSSSIQFSACSSSDSIPASPNYIVDASTGALVSAHLVSETTWDTFPADNLTSRNPTSPNVMEVPITAAWSSLSTQTLPHACTSQNFPGQSLTALIEAYNAHVASTTPTRTLMSTNESNSMIPTNTGIQMGTVNHAPLNLVSSNNAPNVAWNPSIPYMRPRNAHATYNPSTMQQVAGGPSGVQEATGVSSSFYVKNLPPDCDDLALYQTFSPFGAIISCKASICPVTNRCKGVGFVNFVKHECALKAVFELHGLRFCEGSHLSVTLQPPRAARSQNSFHIANMRAMNKTPTGPWQSHQPAYPTLASVSTPVNNGIWYVAS